MEPEIPKVTIVPEVPAVAVEEVFTEPVVEPEAVTSPASRLSPKMKHAIASIGAIALALAVMTSFVYREDPTGSSIRKIVGVIPYPIAVVGSHVITFEDYLAERDALSKYFASTAAQSGTEMPDEETIGKNILDTMAHKLVVAEIASEAGIALDDAKVEEFYATSLGGADPAAFETQLQTMFGWTPEQFKDRVVKPVVLATQVGEAVDKDESRQAEVKQKAQAVYDRVASGEDFAAIATETSADPSASVGGDIGPVRLSDIPEDFKAPILALKPGEYSAVVEGAGYFMIFKAAERTGKDAEESVKLSLISFPKKTLEDIITEYLASHRNWRAIGNT